MSLMDHLVAALMYGGGTILMFFCLVAIVGLSMFLAVDYLRDRRGRS
jgi:hypothetical protein